MGNEQRADNAVNLDKVAAFFGNDVSTVSSSLSTVQNAINAEQQGLQAHWNAQLQAANADVAVIEQRYREKETQRTMQVRVEDYDIMFMIEYLHKSSYICSCI